MATKARQQYFADEVSLSKEKREFSIADEIQQKIDSIEEGAQVNKIETVKVNGTALVPDANKAVNIDVPEVIDNLYTVDSDNALSARQGKLLYDYIQNIASRGRFLSNWNSATGLPMTNPSESPYPYKSGDYFVVSNVAGLGGTNYRPDGSLYIIGQASTVVETENVSVSDFYFYDGTNWLLLSNSGRQIAIDTSLSTTSTNPVENRVITNTLNGKQETLIAGSNIQIAADGKTVSATDTTYSAGANISIDANNEISATDTTYTAGTNVQISNQNVISATDTKYTAGTGINIDANNVISNTQTSAEWGNITGTLSNQTDLQYALNEKQDKLTAGEGIEIRTAQDYSAMRGPCPEGYHIPQSSEWTAIKNIWIALGGGSTAGTNFSIALKLPFAGGRNMYYASNEDVGSKGKYWSCDTNLNTSINASTLLLSSSQINSPGEYAKGAGYSIRGKKDVPVIPTNSWTKLYGTSIAAGGIFWSSTDGLISLSSDGNTWITIADKNLGATQVWNDGDTLSSANSGYYYQWGNNYGFPGMDTDYTTITRSTTKVDASTYGPGNYYSSDTWIRVTSGSWEEPNNTNLWGGITGVVTLNNVIKNTGVLSVNGQTGDVIIQTGGNYTAGDGINIDANNEISNTLPGPTIAATAPTGTEGALWYDTTNDVLMAYNGTAWKEAGTQMKVLSYGHSTWQDFLDAYNENAIVYCRASSNSNPGSGVQGRMAFMAFVSINSTTLLPTEVEFQYYRSRSDHNTAANQLDQVFVYKLTSASGGTWTVTERNTGAKAVAGTGISLGRGSGNMTISADTSVLATKTDLNSKQDTLVSGTNIKTINSNSLLGSGDIALNDVKVSATAPSSPTEGMTWYDTTNHILKVYDGTNWVEPGDNNVKVFTTTNSVVIDGGDFKNDTTLVNTILDINNWMTSSPSHIAYLYYVDGNHMYYKCPVIWCKSSSATKHIAYLLSTGTSPKFDHFHRAYVNLFMSGGTATVGEIILSEAPTYTAGENITIDQNNEISATDTTYTAGEGIAIGAVRPDNQGPCEDGFHIPLHSELQTLFSARTSLGFTDTQSQQFLTYLHIPVGRRDFTGVSEPGDQACLWGADGIEANGEYWVMSIFDSTEHPEDNYIEVTTIWGVSQCFGYPIRAFKDTPIVPDNSWTTEYQGTGNAGIFHNSTLGLISVSSDGTNWITFKDKNLGATTVYNYGDTITDTNLGNVYQRGNNYGFPFTGNITTSSGTVDASNYGPGNYYSSSTFITRTYQTYNQPRDNSGNRNLWGGVSQGTWIGGDGNTIVNTGVLSVNGSTGVVTLNDVKVSSTAPSSPTEGMTWYDTTNDQLKVYDGTNWNVTGKEYNAGEGIEIGTIQDYSAMQGPAPDGFHVPLNTEWQAVYDIWTALGGGSSDGTNFGIALKLPFAGYRFSSSAGVGSQGSYGFYWSSSRNNTNNAYLLNFNSSDVLPQNANYRAFGYSVRCFKNSPTVPTSSWTKLYGTSIEAGGIFWSSTEGLISMSSDGQTWITIQDKNLGATTVWNSGDTLSEANCGKYYQRGNNYGFPRTGSVTTSSTQVDASTYGPGNYYSSSTFITRNSSPYRWDTTDNGNLWGGVTGVVTYDNAIINTGVLSVNGQTGNVTIEAFQLAPNSPLTPKYRRYGSQAQYDALTQYYTDEPGDTVYFTI